MDLVLETESLRKQLRAWSQSPEWSLLIRYELLPQKKALSFQKRLTQSVGRLFRRMGLSHGLYCSQVWNSGLKYADCRPEMRPLLFWSERLDKQAMRNACSGARNLLQAHPGLQPVLVTDQADFAFYSRLHWLVEYLPCMEEGTTAYQDRKKRYLAWRYRDALILPLTAGLATQKEFDLLVAMK